MPQMSPLLWFNLFMMFSITMIMINQIMFFSFNNKMIKMKKKKNNNPKMNWKW
uniref:ATP synthase complex subunit 8 n=1 Tax=Dictyophorus spumans TaxID=1661872 RepID=A0A516IMU6_9ORTH|nr:ATP synthase F0 subunit 8 [Dictyophorus spumans]